MRSSWPDDALPDSSTQFRDAMLSAGAVRKLILNADEGEEVDTGAALIALAYLVGGSSTSSAHQAAVEVRGHQL